ncbi:glycosyl hydrolase, partial [candidate division KSB1 bacterium 4572_119]
MRKILTVVLIFSLILIVNIYAQEKASTPSERQIAFEQRRQEMAKSSLFQNLPFRCVGPVVMSGRAVDIEPHPTDPYTFFVAYATGGLWRTNSIGMNFEPLFDNQNAITIGDIAIDPKNPNIIWVGTGENNSSRSSYAGTGIYKTTDGGKTWRFMGLSDSHHIGRIIIHPKNSDIVYVAALGHLYTENEERGIYRTKDGGKTWENILFINSRTGFIDLVINPKNPDILYGAAWEKDRKAWNLVEGGTSSGIYKSIDSGDSWTLLNGGFPQGEHVGRIGLAIFPENPEIVYALVDNQALRPEEEQKEDAEITARKLMTMEKKDILGLTDDDLSGFLRRFGFHSDYTAKIIRDKLTDNEITVEDLINFIKKNNPHAFDKTIIGGEVYRSENGGATWTKTNEDYIDSFYSTYGYYFGEIRVAPDNADKIYILGVPLLTSDDGGKNFCYLGGKGVHGDHQAFWIDPNFPDHMIDGNDGGLNITYNGGKSWWKLNYVPNGQFYSVNVDMAQPYNIYGGLQDNGVFKGSSLSKPLKSPPWERVYGGDGMYVQIDPEDFTIYTGLQFGNYARINPKSKRSTRITPRPRLFDPGLRYNWQ